MKKTIFIGIAAHKILNYEPMPYHHIIYCGMALNQCRIAEGGEERDDSTSDNISGKNPIYNELSVHYWMWKKNIDADYLGLVHYRRLFDFSGRKKKYGVTPIWHICRRDRIKFGWEKERISVLLERNVDIFWCKGIEQKWQRLEENDWRLLELLEKAVINCFPEYEAAVKSYILGKWNHPQNMCIMKKRLFHKYSEFLFTVLSEMERLALEKDYPRARLCGYAGEHLLNIWCSYQINERKLIVEELPWVLVYHPEAGLSEREKIVRFFKYIYSCVMPVNGNLRKRVEKIGYCIKRLGTL